jgi:hypothetical protein
VLKSVLIGAVLVTLASPALAAGVPAQIGADQPIDRNLMQLMSTTGAADIGTVDASMVQPVLVVSESPTAPPVPETRPVRVKVEPAAVVARPAPAPVRTASVTPERLVVQLDGLWMIGAFR